MTCYVEKALKYSLFSIIFIYYFWGGAKIKCIKLFVP